MLGTVLLLLLSIASLQVWGMIFRRWRQRRPVLATAPRCRSPWLPVASLVAGCYVILLTLPSSPTTVTITQVQHGVMFGLMEIAIALTFLTGGFQASFKDVGFSLSGLRGQVKDGTSAFLACLLPVFVVMFATYWLRTPDNQHAYLKLLREEPSPVNIGWMLVAAVAIAPIKEELLFRVMFQDGLARRIGAEPALVIVAVLFCLVHGFPDSLALFPFALILGYLYQQRQSAWSVIIAHALFNLANLTILLTGGPD